MDRHQQRAARTVIVMHDRAPVQPAGHAGRSAQIVQICVPWSATPGSKDLRQNGGSRATVVTNHRHAARLVFQRVSEPSADYARVTIVSVVRQGPRRSSGSGCPFTPEECSASARGHPVEHPGDAYTLTLVTGRYPRSGWPPRIRRAGRPAVP
jgi:hypothetical protein